MAVLNIHDGIYEGSGDFSGDSYGYAWRDLLLDIIANGSLEAGTGGEIHLVSEALYLRDPDGHGIEIYRDRPRSEWAWENGRVKMASLPVDVPGLLAEAERVVREDWGLGAMRMTVIDVRDELIAFYERRGYRRTGIHKPFPYGDERFGQPKRDNLRFEVMEKAL